jgi:hypothetical protein
MNKIFCLLASLVCASCYAQADKKAEQFQKVFDIISSETVFSTPSSGVLRQLQGMCMPSTDTGDDLLKKGNIACNKSVGVRRFAMANTGADPITMIQSSFFGTDKCHYMISSLTRCYGKPESKQGACEMQWKVKSKRGGALRYADIEADHKTNVVYFDLYEEQGAP